MLQALGHNPSRADVEDMLNLFDTDGSGSLSFAEARLAPPSTNFPRRYGSLHQSYMIPSPALPTPVLRRHGHVQKGCAQRRNHQGVLCRAR